MKRCLALLVMVLAAVPFARADEATKKAKVQELFATMHMERMTDQIVDAMEAQVKQMTATMPGSDQLTDAQKKLISRYEDKVIVLANESMGWKILEPQYETLYASTYSEEEIDGILTFYKSPAGQAMLAKTPQLTAGAMQLVQTKMVDFQPKLKALMDQMIIDIAKTVPNKPPPSKKNM